MVIIQAHDVDLTVAEVTAIEDYITNGGKLIISYWNLNSDTTLQGILGVSNTISFSSPLPITSWETTHAIFNTPNIVNSIAVIGDNGGADNGDKLEPDTGASALAGFTATATANEAAIILSNNSSVLVHGFGGADMDLTAFTDLFENEVNFLLNGATASIQNNDVDISLNAYPNPTSGNISINLGETFQNVKITTSNILGQTIEIQKFNTVSEIKDYYIKGNAGTYFINIQAENGKRASLKIIKK